jgi:hypothetical protein
MDKVNLRLKLKPKFTLTLILILLLMLMLIFILKQLLKEVKTHLLKKNPMEKLHNPQIFSKVIIMKALLIDLSHKGSIKQEQLLVLYRLAGLRNLKI